MFRRKKKYSVLLFVLFCVVTHSSCVLGQGCPDLEERTFLEASFDSLERWSRDRLAARLQGREIAAFLPMSATLLYLVPNRKQRISDEKPLGPDPLLNLCERGIPTIEWRNRYYLTPNFFPYLTDHLLLVTKEAESQSIMEDDSKVMRDIFAIQDVFPDRTFMFNHLAGNSLNHFHLHIAKQPIPVEDLLENKEISLLENSAFEVQDDQVDVKIIDNFTCKRGFYFTGDADRLSALLSSFLHELAHCTHFYYNLIWLPKKDGRFRVLVSIRWRPEFRELIQDPTLPASVIPASLEFMGGLAMVGQPVALSPEDPTKPFLDMKKLDSYLLKNCDYTIFPPENLKRFLEINRCKALF